MQNGHTLMIQNEDAQEYLVTMVVIFNSVFSLSANFFHKNILNRFIE